MPEEKLGQAGKHLVRGAGKSVWLLTDQHTFKAVTADTNGAFTLTEVSAGPNFGPPPHIHHREDECFYILEGAFEFWYGGQHFVAGAGAFVYLPKGQLHKHRAANGAPAKALVMHVPAGLERFIEEAGKPAGETPARPQAPEMAELERIVQIAQKYGIEVPPA